MPVMPRFNKKAEKIAYKIIGKPLPLIAKHTAIQEKVNKKLLFEETYRVR